MKKITSRRWREERIEEINSRNRQKSLAIYERLDLELSLELRGFGVSGGREELSLESNGR
jgi:hypothetical protein